MASSNNDYETDAQEESPSLAVRSSAGSSAPNSNSSIQNIKGIKNNHRFDEYVTFMEPPLNKDNIDILIICAQNDEDSALILKKDIEKLKKSYRVEIIDSELTQPDILEEFFKRSMFYFLFVTEEFSMHGKALFKAHTFLNETLDDNSKNWSIIPVYPCSNNDKKYLNFNYRGLTPIRYFESKDKFSLSINNLFDGRKNKIIKKDLQLQLDRERYFDKHETELIELKKIYLLKETSLNEQSLAESESLFVKYKPHDPPIEENAQRNLCDTLAKQKLDDIGDNLSNADAATPATLKNPVDKHQIAGTEIYFGDDIEVDGPPTYPAKKEFIGVFWDLQNCPVPRNKSAADIIERIRAKYILVDANNVEKCFYCITDVTKEHQKTREAITSCGVDLLHMCSDKKNASDTIIDAKMREFYENFGAAKVILISSDVDFSQTLAYLKKRRCQVILLHRVNIKPELLHSVNESCSYEDLIEELPDKHEILSESEPFLIVHGYKQLPGENAKDFKNILETFFSPWKGKVVNQRGTKFGILKFENLEKAKRAKENTNGKDPFQENTNIIVCFLEGAPDEIRKSVDIDAENSTQNDVTVDGAPATLVTSTADSGVFSDGDMGVSSHVKVGDDTILNKQNNTNEQKPSAETKGSVSKVMKGKLKAEDNQRIRHNYVYLKQEIDGKHIVDHLYQRYVISSDDKEEIDSLTTKSQRTDKLLTILLNAGPGAAYQVFYDALKEQYPHVAKVLDGTPLQNLNEAREGKLC